MVLLIMTSAVVAAVKIYTKHSDYAPRDGEPSLDTPAVGNPISHGQLIDISKYLKANPEKVEGDGLAGFGHLSELLKGCAIYIPPPPPKQEKVRSYSGARTNVANAMKDERIQSAHGSAAGRGRGPQIYANAQYNACH
jgi:hypothetical protein